VTADGRAPSQRLFFASWPDAATRAALRAAATRRPVEAGRAIAPDHLHLTLAFLGSVAVAEVGRLTAIGAALAWPASDVLLDRLDYWPRARILAAVPSSPPPALLELEAQLHGRLDAAGFAVDAQRFRPHVTLARDVPALPAAALAPPVAWPLAELALVVSETAPGGSRYRPLARWRAAA
jgi:RNA 2',3'-cyclic 3'-phosphodiesterase